MAGLRIWLLALVAVGAWIFSVYGTGPSPRPADAPATVFSAARADAVLARLLGPERPRPTGSPEAAAFRKRLEAELDRIGVTYQERTQQSCYGRRRWRACGTVTNIYARAVPGTGREVLLMAHTDSVPRGPGAADDGSGVAVILETLRALKARHPVNNRPVAALFTDGEEKGLLGAAAYARDPAARARTGAVVNVEARGNRGPSLLFQTSPGDAALIDLYARAAPHPSASSVYAEIYRRLPNDTDLTPFLAAGVTGVNFAFIGGVRDYHSANDRRANISRRSLQHQGENVLAMTAALAQARGDPAALNSGNAVYLDIFRAWLPRLAVPWALPLAIAAFLAIGLAGWLTPREGRVSQRPAAAGLAPLLLLVLCVAAGFVLHGLAAWIGGSANSRLPDSVWLRWSLAFGVWAAALLAARWAGAIAGWLWFAGLAVVTAIWLPGLSPYFLFPALVAAPLLLATVRGGRAVAYFLAALAALAIWVPFNAGTEDIGGLALHPLFTVTAGFAVLSLLPLMAGRRAGLQALASFALALLLAVVAGFSAA
jgi:hypothetical protein